MRRLRYAEQRFDTLIEASMDGYWMVDMQGRILDVNDIYCRMIGYSREELLHMTIPDVEVLESPEETARHIQHVMEHGADRFETRHLRKDGQVLDIEVSAHFMSDEESPQFLVFLRDITAHKQRDAQKLAYAAAQRDTLVREVNHRIKNNLQGVATLLRQHMTEYPQAAPILEKAIAQVMAVAIVHGLQGEARSQVALCDMVRAISRDLQELTPLPLRLEMVPHFRPVLLAGAETVPVALIINELLFNAVKHGSMAQPSQAILVTMQGSAKEMRIIVQGTHGRLPAGFDFANGRGLGIGLSLVRSLLPAAGASLDIAGVDGGVRAELRLSPPVLIDAGAKDESEPCR